MDYMEVWEPTPQEQALISYQQKTRTDQGSDYSDSVLSFKFKKKKPKENWVMRILYYDNLRVIGSGKWCRWEVTVEGGPCPVPIAGSVHTNNGDNDHYPATMMGECAGFEPGDLTIDVAVTSSSGADCYTGWTPPPHIMHSLLEVQESPTIWTIVFQEEEGSGNGAKFDNHPLRTLSLNKPPFDLKLGNYRVRNLTTILYELYPSINPRLILNLATTECEWNGERKGLLLNSQCHRARTYLARRKKTCSFPSDILLRAPSIII